MWACKLMILALLTSILIGQDQLIDFTYTQLLQEVGSNGDQNDRINIFPDTTKQEQYEFPQVCQLKAQLEEGTDSTGSVVDIFDVQDHLITLRSRVLHLLRLAEQIKKSKANLRQIKKHLHLQQEKDNSSKYSSKFNSEVGRLAQKQNELKILKNKIEDLTSRLNQLVVQYNNNPKNQQFHIAAFNYEIDSYSAKIQYLLQLKDKARRKIDQQQRINYTAYFHDLEGKMEQQSQLIIEIDHILTNFSDVNYLKSKIAGLQSQVAALNLYIQEKENCINEKDKARKKGSNEEIKDTMEKLRHKKKQFGKTINKYCEGVAKKLESQIKKLLKVFNLTYSCAEGLTDLQKDRSKQQIQLQNTRRRLKLIEQQGFDQYHNRYNKTRDDIRFRLQKIKTFTINEYVHNISQIEELIESARTAKSQAQQHLKNIPQASQSDTTIMELRNLVHQIKVQKAHYCAQFDRYEQRSRHIWKKVYQFQGRQKLQSKMRRVYMEEGKLLRNLEDTFKASSEQIITLLSK